MIDIYVHIFNLIFDTGILPEAWLIGYMIPIFKNKGSKLDPKNYTILVFQYCKCTILVHPVLYMYDTGITSIVTLQYWYF
jgi:hypothetical protein